MTKIERSARNVGKHRTSRPAQAGKSEDAKSARKRFALVGLVGAVFGVIYPIALLLPASTLLDKVRIVIACGALSVASVIILGACGKNARQLWVTAGVMFLAGLCLAGLSAGRAAMPQQPVLHEPVASSSQALPRPGRTAPEGAAHHCHRSLAYEAWPERIPDPAKAWQWWPGDRSDHDMRHPDGDNDHGNVASRQAKRPLGHERRI